MSRDVTNNVMQVTRIEAPIVAGTQEKKEIEAPEEAAQVQEAEAISEEEMHEVVNRMNDFVQSTQRNLSFSIDDETGRDIVRVIE